MMYLEYLENINLKIIISWLLHNITKNKYRLYLQSQFFGFEYFIVPTYSFGIITM